MLRIGLQKNIPELQRKIRIFLKEMDVNLVQSIAGSVQKRLHTLHRKDYYALKVAILKRYRDQIVNLIMFCVFFLFKYFATLF